MQHLDEGTIHAWLDGALSTDEAAKVELHVAECPRCANAVAEARGFIAASSRILTKLDDAPRGVIPVEAPRRRNLAVWRAAAAVLVVALGSIVVVRNRSGEMSATASREVRTTDSVTGVGAVRSAATDSQSPRARVFGTGGTAAASAVSGSPSIQPPRVAESPRERMAPSLAKSAVVERGSVAGQAMAPAAAPSANAAPAVAFDAAKLAEVPLVLVREDTIAQGKRSVYAVTSGDTVTLIEASVAAPTAARSRAMSMRDGAAAKVSQVDTIQLNAGTAIESSAALSARSGSATQRAAAKTVAPATPTTVLAPVNTLRWVDTSTGKQFTLSGRLPTVQLEEIRHRIERDRAQREKKSP